MFNSQCSALPSYYGMKNTVSVSLSNWSNDPSIGCPKLIRFVCVFPFTVIVALLNEHVYNLIVNVSVKHLLSCQMDICITRSCQSATEDYCGPQI